MSTTLERRLNKLMKQHGLDDSPIIAGRMEPEHWARIKWNKDIHVILWYPEKYDSDKTERLADIERLKKCVSNLSLVFQSDGYAIWENGKCTKDGGLLGRIKQ